MVQSVSRRGTGAIFDTPHRRRMYAPALGPKGLFSNTPTLTTGTQSLAVYEAPVTDQGPNGACEGYSSAMAAWMTFAATLSPLAYFPSMDGIYRDARCQARTPNADGSLPALTDSGAMTSDVATIFQTCGLRPMGPKVDGRNGDTDPTTINNEPTLDQLDTEALTSILVDPGAYAIDLSNTQEALAVIQAALKAKFAVRIDIICDSIFQNWFEGYTRASTPINTCNPNDPTAGGHAIVLSDMLVYSDNTVVLGGLNSWGAIGAPPMVSGGPNQAGHWRGTANWFKLAVMQATVWACSRAQS